VPEGDAGTEPHDDERWLVIKGRRWRRTDPCLPDDLVAALKSHLGTGRSTVGAAKRSGDDDRVLAARRRVGLAKLGLGGTVLVGAARGGADRAGRDGAP
jgi:hypothetical protein